ncbi:hypothetical protein ACTJIJ_09410 [Niabella sp. 22666]|uniref:hypothetical protein n=1 Tax=Niabella sp. 22666 TaxID=3453954 RepID=UPI003F84BFFD
MSENPVAAFFYIALTINRNPKDFLPLLGLLTNCKIPGSFIGENKKAKASNYQLVVGHECTNIMRSFVYSWPFYQQSSTALTTQASVIGKKDTTTATHETPKRQRY